MAVKADFEDLAREVVSAFGGAENIRSVVHCATRLRFALVDAARADVKAAESAPGVLTVVTAGGQHQVVVGNDVPFAYEAVVALPGMQGKGGKESAAAESAPKRRICWMPSWISFRRFSRRCCGPLLASHWARPG